MRAQYFNADYLGDRTPWFGPLLADYRPVFSCGMYGLDKGEHDVTAWVWDAQGNLLAEKIVRSCRADDLVTFDAEQTFPGVIGQAGTVGIMCRARDGRPKKGGEAWVVRYVAPNGKLAGVVYSGNPLDLNFSERTGRRHSYRMCSQELLVDADWKTLSWHGNVSANADYAKPIKVRLFVLDQNGNKLDGPDQTIPPFGSVMVDLEAVFGARIRQHLADTGGRGSYMMHSVDGGAVGYHFLQNRRTGELASDHTRPVAFYLNHAYGWTADGEPASPIRYLRSAARYAKFRLSGLRP
jgi:hypothetical protein